VNFFEPSGIIDFDVRFGVFGVKSCCICLQASERALKKKVSDLEEEQGLLTSKAQRGERDATRSKVLFVSVFVFSFCSSMMGI
jgi:hypothetical protein